MMAGRVQAALALTMAAGLHLGAFALWPQGSAAPASASAGDGGDALVTIAPQDGTVAALVAQWDRPPLTPAVDTLAMMAPPDAPVPLASAPDAPLPAPVPVLPAPLQAAPDLMAPALPAPLPSPPEMRPDPAPAPQARPKPRREPAPAASRQPEKPKAPASTAGSQAAAKAEGSGGKARAGAAGQAEAGTASKARQADLQAGWGAAIRARVDRNKRQPPGGPSTGAVTVRLVVGRGGDLQGVSVTRSSGHAVLDQAALAAVRRAGRFPAAPQGLDRAQYGFSLTIRFAR
jgi:periplasmic protein TonB